MTVPTCPVCGDTQIFLLYSRVQAAGTMRRRTCRACGHRWATMEVALERYREIAAATLRRQESEPAWLTVKEAAAVFGLPVTTIHSRIVLGQFESERVPRGEAGLPHSGPPVLLVRRVDVEAYAAARKLREGR